MSPFFTTWRFLEYINPSVLFARDINNTKKKTWQHTTERRYHALSTKQNMRLFFEEYSNYTQTPQKKTLKKEQLRTFPLPPKKKKKNFMLEKRQAPPKKKKKNLPNRFPTLPSWFLSNFPWSARSFSLLITSSGDSSLGISKSWKTQRQLPASYRSKQ